MSFRHGAVLLVCTAMIIGVSFEGSSPSLTSAKDAVAEPKKKVRKSRCVRYNQVLGGDKQSVDISLRNRCKAAVTCSVEWKVTCDSDPADAEAKDFARVVEIGGRDRESVNASAAVCGDDGWAVDDIKWECESM